MNLQDILAFNFEKKNVCIIGHPASGKTHLSNLICPNHHKIHTDSYIGEGYLAALHSTLHEIHNTDKHTLVEGVICYRLLRKGVELASYYPDIIIRIEISPSKQKEIYEKERDAKKLKYMDSFNKSDDTLFNQFLEDCPVHNLPLVINFYNNF